MQLCFLGQTYSTSNHQIDTAATEHTAHFLGQSYTPRRPVTNIKSQLGERKYRGIAYRA